MPKIRPTTPFSVPAPVLRLFAIATVEKKEKADQVPYRMWIDAAFLESDEIEMAYEEMPDDEVGIDLYIPAAQFDRKQSNPSFQNVRLETGRGGLWITPAFVIALFVKSEIPGFVFIRLAERVGTWIKIKGEPGAIAANLRLHLASPPKAPKPLRIKPTAPLPPVDAAGLSSSPLQTV